MLELATLGALMAGAQHGYALKAWLERYMGAFLTVNYGAIYPLLRKLEQQGLIVAFRSAEEEPRRLTYEITPAGRERFHSEMLSVPNESKANARSRFMTKVYFFSNVPSQNRVAILQARYQACRERSSAAESYEVPADDYQQQVFGFAMQQLAAEMVWIESQLTLELAARQVGITIDG